MPRYVVLTDRPDYHAIVIEKPDDLDKIDYSRPVHLYAQTTMNREAYTDRCNE